MQKTVSIYRFFRALGLGVALMAALSQTAFAATLELKTEAFKEVEQVGADGKKIVKRVPLTHATPGTEVIYVITYHNGGTEPATNVKIDNSVPKGLQYQLGSALGDGTVVEFSVDGGAHFGPMNTLSVTGADGKSHTAKGSDVTTIRWVLQKAVPAAGDGSVTYRAMLP